MKLSSVVLLLVFYLSLGFFMDCASTKKQTQQKESDTTTFRDPKLTFTFSSVFKDEKPIIDNYFKNLKQSRSLARDELERHEDFGYEYRLELNKYENIDALFDKIQELNQEIIDVGKSQKNHILGGDKITVRVGYISTHPTTKTSAKLAIMPEPRGAKLFIDTKIPDIEQHLNPFDGSIILNIDGRFFETILPFSFIIENPRIYFLTSLNNITRYFYYDLKLEKQIEIFGIKFENDYKYYQKHGKLPESN